MRDTTLSFRANNDFAEQTKALASSQGLKSSDYIRQAVLDKNKAVLAAHVAALSKELSAEHLALNAAMEDSISDGMQ